jgi:hypothetical protein
MRNKLCLRCDRAAFALRSRCVCNTIELVRGVLNSCPHLNLYYYEPHNTDWTSSGGRIYGAWFHILELYMVYLVGQAAYKLCTGV